MRYCRKLASHFLKPQNIFVKTIVKIDQELCNWMQCWMLINTQFNCEMLILEMLFTHSATDIVFVLSSVPTSGLVISSESLLDRSSRSITLFSRKIDWEDLVSRSPKATAKVTVTGYVYTVPLGRHLSLIFDPNTIDHNNIKYKQLCICLGWVTFSRSLTSLRL